MRIIIDQNYELAMVEALKLYPLHPIRLGVILNYTIFLWENFKVETMRQVELEDLLEKFKALSLTKSKFNIVNEQVLYGEVALVIA